MRRWLTVALGGLVLSCQGPAAVLAQQQAPATAQAAITAAHRDRALDTRLTGTNWAGVGVKSDVTVPADRALDEALRLAGA